MAKRRLMVTREDVERSRPGATWVSDHKLTVILVPEAILTLLFVPVYMYAPTWSANIHLLVLLLLPILGAIWFFRA